MTIKSKLFLKKVKLTKSQNYNNWNYDLKVKLYHKKSELKQKSQNYNILNWNYDLKRRNYDLKSQNYGTKSKNYNILSWHYDLKRQNYNSQGYTINWNYDIKCFIMTKVEILS